MQLSDFYIFCKLSHSSLEISISYVGSVRDTVVQSIMSKYSAFSLYLFLWLRFFHQYLSRFQDSIICLFSDEHSFIPYKNKLTQNARVLKGFSFKMCSRIIQLTPFNQWRWLIFRDSILAESSGTLLFTIAPQVLNMYFWFQMNSS